MFSSNFSLYTNMSDRVMETLSSFTPKLEVYSVDEAFLDLSDLKNVDITDYLRNLKRIVERNTGIPISIGVGPTKTLAKVANNLAKKSEKSKGVVNLLETRMQDVALKRTKIEDVWGIGKAISTKMKAMGIHDTKQLKDFKNDLLIKKLFIKVGLQRKEELNGLPRFELEVVPKKKKEIICSRTFSEAVFDIESIREAIAKYVTTAAEKLRKQDSVCARVEVFARTSPFKNVSQYYAFEQKKMLSSTSDTTRIIRYAFEALDKLYRAGFEYKKTGIRLTSFTNKNESQISLFDEPISPNSDSLMKAVDLINRKEGPGTVKSGACGVDNNSKRMAKDYKSSRYVSGWTQIRRVK